jgi:glycosyltransferase involved in cell wall biosynthesis
MNKNVKKVSHKRKEKLLSVSVVIATFNSARTIKQALESVRSQNYPQKKIEIVIADGGSTDKTLTIVKKYNVRVLKVPKELQNAEYNKGIGINAAKKEILLMLDSDNMLPHTEWIRKMIVPFIEHNDVVGVEPLRFHYDPKMTLLDRYFSLLGGNDPVAYYLNKDSHLSWAFDRYNLYGKSKDLGDYYLVKFLPGRIPALGGNGAAIRRELLLKEASADPDHFFHIDVNVDLIRKGFNTYGIFKDSIIHLTNNSVIPFLKRRQYYIVKYHFEDMSKRRFSVYEPPKDTLNLIKYCLYSVTFVKPLYDSFRGYIKVQDGAWFLHPVMCFAMLIIYGSATVKKGFKGLI